MKMKKALALLLAAVLLVGCSVMGTLAYLSSTTEVAKNTFTVGKIEIKLDETNIDGKDADGNENSTESRDIVNRYEGENKLIPGQSVVKDPTVWVKKGSEPAYIRMMVTVENYDELKEALDYDADKYIANDMVILSELVTWNYNTWQFVPETFAINDTSAVYEFRFYPNDGIWNNHGELAEGSDYYKLPALFEQINVPKEINNTDLEKLGTAEIKVVAHAIQAEGFENTVVDDVTVTAAQNAWSAFGDQNSNA